ncbi:MAG: tetratricopeptide repeat protein [Bryobacteraceae bacterium]|nr:tetratricopeptide repeat protein [Bryobacteraceae bacterium]
MTRLLLLLACALPALAQSAADLAELYWKQRRWEDANAAFRAAVKADPKNPMLRVRWGLLLLERFNPGEAADLFNEALEIEKDFPPALLGLARVAAERMDARAAELCRKALEKDPKLDEARELLANVLLEDGDFDAAAAEAQKLGARPGGRAVLAAIALLRDRDASAELAAMGRYAPGYARIARHLVLNRRYEEGIEYYRKAVEIDPEFHAARSELGINLMRVGRSAEARRELETAYEAGYRSAPTANSLKLLDTLEKFETVRRPRYVLRFHRSEAKLLAPYFERELARALDTYERKYGFRLPGPVQVEVYNNHADFEVRTLGVPGLGALGVAFGLSLAMDSPSARPPGAFHWASTLWHELSHVYVITATRHRVPRWFTEGVSVHEETAANPEWGDRLTPDILAAIRKGELLPVDRLDRGFQRPRSPGQVTLSYFQAGRIIDYITRKWGWEKVAEMMRAFARPVPASEVFPAILGISTKEFDDAFLAWLKEEHRAALDNFDRWTREIKLLHEARRAENWPEARRLAESVIAAFPEYVDAGNGYEALAEICSATGDSGCARDALARYMKQGGRNPESIKKLARMLEQEGRAAEAEAALARLLWIYPVKDEDLHRRLATLREILGRWDGAAEEWRAVLASGTVDPASAWYGLALASSRMGRTAEAREAVLAALEEAPGYRPAQKLLLELTRAEQERKND